MIKVLHCTEFQSPNNGDDDVIKNLYNAYFDKMSPSDINCNPYVNNHLSKKNEIAKTLANFNINSNDNQALAKSCP